MMLQILAYTVLVTAALTVVGHCLERLAALYQLPRRTAWVTVMVLSVLFPVAMMLASRTEAPPASILPAPSSASSPVGTATAVEQAPIWKLAAPSDRQVLTMWAAGSLVFALYLTGASLLLRLRAARWQRAIVEGQEVLISQSTGPALLRVFHPQIVVPRWLLQQTRTTQSMILEHERQHMVARDPLLMLAGLLVIVAVPWNLPLWWQWRRMRNAMEVDCDARVLRTGADADAYADVLLEVTRCAARIFPGALAMNEPAAALEQRIDSLVPSRTRYAVAQTVAALGLAVAGVGVAFALNAPALPLHSRATVTLEVQAVAVPVVPVVPVMPAPVVQAAEVPAAVVEIAEVKSKPTANTEDTMNKTNSIVATVAALGAAAAAAAADAPAPEYVPPPDDGRQASALQIIAANDQDGDGIVTKEEATKADKSLILMWGFYDRDRDGRVTPQEIDRATSAMYVATAEEKITGERSSGPAMVKPDQVIRTNDLDGDGFVTREEATKVGASLARLWQAYDIDKDGRVDAAEIAKAQNY